MKNPNKSLPLYRKVVWVTGASSGIGEQLCYQFAEAGASVILSARNISKLEQVKLNLSSHGDEALVLPLDLEHLDQLSEKVDQAFAHFGQIDYLINNAGVALRDFALSTRLEIDQKLMNINYFGPVVLTKHVLPHMLKRGSGHVVVIGSLSGKYGIPRTSAYAASKHALHGFFDTLRSEIAGQGVFITIIVPGIIQTEITNHALVGDGALFGRLEKTFQQAYPVDKAAGKMLRAILNRKEEVFVGGMEGITLFLNRLSPWLLSRLVRNHPMKRLRKFKQLLYFKKKE